MSKLTDQVRPLLLLQGVTALTGGSATDLDGIATAALPVPLNGWLVVSGAAYFYQLRAGTDAASSPEIIRPTDYADGTNEKVWEKLGLVADLTDAGALIAANNLSDLLDAAAARGNLELGTSATLDAGAADGVAQLDSAGKVPTSQLPAAVLGSVDYQGVWDASTNTPDLSALTPTKGNYWKVSVAGSTDLGGITDWNVGDWAVYDPTGWQKVDNSEEDATSTVKGRLRLTGDLAGTASSPAIATGACTDTKIGNRTADDTLATPNSTGTLTQLLSWIAGRIKGITGKASWLTAPRTTLENAVKLDGDTMTGALGVGVAAAAGTLIEANGVIRSRRPGVGGQNVELDGGSSAGINISAHSLLANVKPLAIGSFIDPADIATSSATNTIVFRFGNASAPVDAATLSSAGLVVTNRITAGKWSNTQSALTYGATAAIDFDAESAKTLALTGDWAPTTSNRAAGRMKKIKILCDATGRSFTWPAGWKWLGSAAPASIAANKTAVLTLECWGSNDSDITAAYSVEP